MNLDPCLGDRKPFSCLNAEEAQVYLNKPCFFCDDLNELSDIMGKCHLGYLLKVNAERNLPFETGTYDFSGIPGTQSLRFCIPFEWLCKNAGLDIGICEDKELRKSEMKRLSMQFNLLNRYDKAIKIW